MGAPVNQSVSPEAVTGKREEVGYSSLFLPETWGRLQNSCSFGHKRISKPREVIFLGSPSEEEFYDKQISCILPAVYTSQASLDAGQSPSLPQLPTSVLPLV